MLSQSNMNGANLEFNSNYKTIEIRLDTQKLIEKIEIFLRGGKTIYVYDKDEKLHKEYIESGIKKCNDLGVQTLLNWITGTINAQIVQGNFMLNKKTGESDIYNDYIEEYNKELASQVILNLYDWDMSESDAEGVINFIMLVIIPFMTRLIDNKERESYGQSMRSVESNSVQTPKGFGFGLNKEGV
jgi:hypothetical protein